MLFTKNQVPQVQKSQFRPLGTLLGWPKPPSPSLWASAGIKRGSCSNCSANQINFPFQGKGLLFTPRPTAQKPLLTENLRPSRQALKCYAVPKLEAGVNFIQSVGRLPTFDLQCSSTIYFKSLKIYLNGIIQFHVSPVTASLKFALKGNSILLEKIFQCLVCSQHANKSRGKKKNLNLSNHKEIGNRTPKGQE